MGKKLYALCCGINDYQYVSKLRGCVPDAQSMAQYLKDSTTDSEYELDLVELHDDQATKANIVNNFLNHLGKATSEDVAVFYFSGHGAEEACDEIFQAGGDQHSYLTTMVCYDSRNAEGVTDLADKELRYLIAKVAENEPHFVLITDSCHSGGATRSADPPPEELTARLTEKVGARPWERFIFHEDFPYDAVKGQSLRDWLPEGKHIHLSSCKSDELAYEVRGSGVFTSTLIEILKRSAGKVNYQNLSSRVKHFTKGRYPQTPQIFEAGGGTGADKDALKKYFLGGAASTKGRTCNVLYNRKVRKWVIDVGAIHGIPPVTPDSPVRIDVLDLASKKIATAKVVEVQPNLAYVELDAELDNTDSYSGLITGIFLNPMQVAVRAEGDAKAAVDAYLDSKRPDGEKTYREYLKDNNVEFIAEETNAAYVLYAKDDVFSIVKPFDDKPLCQQAPEGGKSDYLGKEGALYDKMRTNAINKECGFLEHIARWEFTRDMNNPKTKLFPNPPIELNIYNADTGDKIEIADGQITVSEGTEVRIEMVNKSKKTLYITCLYMSMLFEVYDELIPEKVVDLSPNEKAYAYDGDPIPVELEEYLRDYGYTKGYFDLKIIAATTEFNTAPLVQDALLPPGDVTGHRGLRKKAAHPEGEDWCSFIVRINTPVE